MPQVIKCIDCGAGFELSDSELVFFDQKAKEIPGFVLPKRCRPCRLKRKKLREGRQ